LEKLGTTEKSAAPTPTILRLQIPDGIRLVFVTVNDSIDGKFRYAAGNTRAELEIDSPPIGEPSCTARLPGAEVSVG
jgi:hypothetical protein